MEVEFLLNYINLVTLGICLCLGYAIKNAKLFEKIGNQYIPLAMLSVGVIINIFANKNNMSSSIILEGMVSGLASTGLYEMLRNILTKNENK